MAKRSPAMWGAGLELDLVETGGGRHGFRFSQGTARLPPTRARLGKGDPYKAQPWSGQRRHRGGCGPSYLPTPSRRPALFVGEQIDNACVRCFGGWLCRCCPRRQRAGLGGPAWARCGRSPGLQPPPGRLVTATCNPCCEDNLSGSRSQPAERRRSPAKREPSTALHPSAQRRCPAHAREAGTEMPSSMRRPS